MVLLVEAAWPVPQLSIVIPSSRDTEALEMTLAAALEHQPDDCEVIVVNDGSYDDPYKLGAEVRFIDAAATANPIDLLNAGSPQRGRWCMCCNAVSKSSPDGPRPR